MKNRKPLIGVTPLYDPETDKWWMQLPYMSLISDGQFDIHSGGNKGADSGFKHDITAGTQIVCRCALSPA